jgi:CO/xanthine dehydrogenase Mo-binding subunit
MSVDYILLHKKRFGDHIKEGKVRGTYKYVGDLYEKDGLYGAVLRPDHPHGEIISISLEKVRKAPGIRDVFTWRDIKGLNRFGSVMPHQPVFCEDRFRFIGDSLALVVGDSLEEVREALRYAKVNFRPLPVISSIEEALKPKAFPIHEAGNIAAKFTYEVGNKDKAKNHTQRVFEAIYETPRQKHMYMETESALAVPQDGKVRVYASTQSPYKDRDQICSVLNLSRERVEVVPLELGGGFGGKEHISAQIHAALAALKTKRPVKVEWTREESGVAGTTRHHMKIRLKTGISKEGALTFNEAEIFADTGAYITFGPTVLEVAGGSIHGPYRYLYTSFTGLLVHTNNPPAGALRGFGSTQANFAMECHMNMIAEELGFDPIDIRIKNALRDGEPDGTGTIHITKVRLREVLQEAKKSPLWSYKGKVDKMSWLRYGVGMAAGMKSIGYGAYPDVATVRLEVREDGFYLLYSSPDMGTGTREALAKIASKVLEVPLEEVHSMVGSTEEVPDSGVSNASRTIYIVGNAVVKACKEIKERLKDEASKYMHVRDLEYDKGFLVAKDGRRVHYRKLSGIRVEATYTPKRRDPLPGFSSIPDAAFSYCAAIALVEVDIMSGLVRVLKVHFIPEVGKVIDRKGLEGQITGGVAQSVGFTLLEHLEVKGGYVINSNFTTYKVPTAMEVPEILITPLDTYEPTGPLGAKGVGELPTLAVPAAIVDAINDAVGVRVSKLPIDPQVLIYKIS